MVITRKIELHLVHTGLSDEEYNQQWKFLHNINDNLYRAANRLVNQLYLNDEIDTLLRYNNKEYMELRKQLAKKNLDKPVRVCDVCLNGKSNLSLILYYENIRAPEVVIVK